MPKPVRVSVPPLTKLLSVRPFPPEVETFWYEPSTCRSMVWFVAPVNVKFSKPVTLPAKALLPEAVAANAAVIFRVSLVPVPAVMAAVGVTLVALISTVPTPLPRVIALDTVEAVVATVVVPVPPVKVALDASMVTLTAPVDALEFTFVTVLPLRSAVMPAPPVSVTVLSFVNPAVDVSVNAWVPPTFRAVTAPKVIFAKVLLAPDVVTFNVV